jgi:hypothetical protein
VNTTTPERPDTIGAERATVIRVRIVAAVLSITAVAAVAVGLLWPEPAGGGETYEYADIVATRDLWWGLLGAGAVLAVINVPMQALATLLLVRERGSAWATWGAAAMWLGAALQATGVAGWASAYFYATDPQVDAATGQAVIAAANADQAHLFALMIPGALLVMVGTIVQCVGLFRARVVPTWIPVATLFTILTFVIPGNGIAGAITSAPMAAGSIGLAYFAVRRTTASATQ